MSEVGLDPFGVHQLERAQAIEQGVDRALDDDEVGVVFEMAQDLEAVEAVLPEGGKDGEFERAPAELDLPSLGVLGGLGFCHGKILCSARYRVNKFS
jgi:hypothetical protein